MDTREPVDCQTAIGAPTAALPMLELPIGTTHDQAAAVAAVIVAALHL